MVRLGFIGFGEAAYEMSCGFKAEGKDVEIRAFDVAYKNNKANFDARAEKAGIELVESLEELIGSSEVIMSMVPTAYTLTTAMDAMKYFGKGQLFADASTSLPDDMVEVAKAAAERGIDFADVAMLGSLPKDKHKVPILVSGTGADRFLSLMQPHGMDIEKVSDKAGDASAIKLTRSIYMKGLATLMTETLMCAYKNNIQDKIIESISGSLDGEKFIVTANRLISGNAIHSERRIHEMESVIQFAEECGLTPTMTIATKKALEELNGLKLMEYFKESKPKNYLDVMNAMRVKGIL
jgi:3-hydroxyisobutyrate dehydrogenase-like beta-hydroxyacid dehydrogenase